MLFRLRRFGHRRRLLIICILALAILSCQFLAPRITHTAPFITQTAGVSPTPTPSCDPLSVVNITRLRHVMVDFYCGVTASQRERVMEYLDAALRGMPHGIDPAQQVIVFVNLDQGVQAEFQWKKAKGYGPMDLASIRESWEGFSGKQLEGAVLIYLRRGLGNSGPSAVLAELVIHEMHHVLQDELQTGSLTLPPWLVEGGADSFARTQVMRLGFPSWSFGEQDGPECNYPLSKLAYDDPKLPIDCRYMEGEKAVTLLVNNFGTESYYDLFRMAIAGRSFKGIFLKVYGISLEDFYRLFDEYRNSGYTDAPRLLAPVSRDILRTAK